jgi:hypothetical protein
MLLLLVPPNTFFCIVHLLMAQTICIITFGPIIRPDLLNRRFRAAEVSEGHNCSSYLGHNMGPLSYYGTLHRPFVLLKTLELLYRPCKFSLLSKDVTWVDTIKPLTDLCCDI